jgi:quinol monooxygenase YgiN
MTATQEDDKPWALTVTFDIVSGSEQRFVDLVTSNLDIMRHEETFLSASLSVDPQCAGRFFLLEVWKSRAEFVEVQLKRDYRIPYEEGIKPLLAREREFNEWGEIWSSGHLTA